MLEYLEPRCQLPIADANIAAYHNVSEELLPTYLHSVTNRRLQVYRGKLWVLSRQQPCWLNEKGKTRPYTPQNAYAITQRLRYVPVYRYTCHCLTEGRIISYYASAPLLTCPMDASHTLAAKPTRHSDPYPGTSPTFLTLQKDGTPLMTGRTTCTLQVSGPLLDLVSTASGLYAVRANGEVYYARTVTEPFGPSFWHDAVKVVELVVSENKEGWFSAVVTWRGELAVKGQYHDRYYPSFTVVPWPD